jgi:hypothetical protein
MMTVSNREGSVSKLPPLLSSRPREVQVLLACAVPAVFGAICGWVLGVNEVAYLVLAVPLALLGGLAAGFEHSRARAGAARGLVGGTLFGAFILIVHEILGKEAKAELPEPAIVLVAVTAIFGALMGAIGGHWRGEREKGRLFDLAELSPGEFLGMVAGLVLVGSLFLPWFGTSATNPNSKLYGASGGDTVNAFQTFSTLDWLLISNAAAPFILSWILARRHALTWRIGEVTMIVGISAFVLILCNGIILGRPKDPGAGAIEISLQIGYFVGLLAAAGMLVAGYLRQAVYTDARKPPGVL